MKSPSPSVMRRLLPLALLALSTACLSSTDVQFTRVVSVENMVAPDTVQSGQPLNVAISFLLSPCDDRREIIRRTSGQVLEIEVRARYREQNNQGCPDMLIQVDTTVTFATPPTGTLLVRGLRLEQLALEETVVVLP